MKQLKIIAVIVCLVAVALPAITEASSRKGPSQAKTGSGAKAVDPRAIRAAQRSKAHRQLNRAQAQKNRLRQEIPDLQRQIEMAKNAEQSVRRRFANEGSSRAVGLINRATLDRANLENKLGNATVAYRQAKASVTAAERVLRQERATTAATQSAQRPKARRASPGMKISFAPGTKLAGQSTGKVRHKKR